MNGKCLYLELLFNLPTVIMFDISIVSARTNSLQNTDPIREDDYRAPVP